MNEEHKNFIRISWKEAREILDEALKEKYKAEGEVKFMKDYGYDGVGDFYDEPTFVDIYLDNPPR